MRIVALEAGSSGAFQVVDVTGKVIGQLFDSSSVIRDVDGFPLRLRVGVEGFVESFLPFSYAARDCGGTAYMFASTQLVRGANVVDGTGYYAGDPFGVVTILSQNDSLGRCFNLSSPEDRPVALPSTFETAAIGEPPFHVR